MFMSIWQRHSLAHFSVFSTIARLYIRDQYKEENSSVPCHTLQIKWSTWAGRCLLYVHVLIFLSKTTSRNVNFILFFSVRQLKSLYAFVTLLKGFLIFHTTIFAWTSVRIVLFCYNVYCLSALFFEYIDFVPYYCSCRLTVKSAFECREHFPALITC